MTALDLLELQKLYVVHAGNTTFPLHGKVTAIAANRLLSDLV